MPTGYLHRSHLNEDQNGPLPGVLRALRGSGETLHRYPEPYAETLTEALAAEAGVSAERVVVGAGSAVMLQQLMLSTVVDRRGEAVYPWLSFEAYPALCELAGLRQIRVPLVRDRQDLAAVADAVTSRTNLVLICNPNNPTGTVVAAGELDALLDRLPGHVLVVLDEAYREFVTDPAVPDGLRRYRDRPNVAVLRTLSKAYALAGLRIGYLVAAPEVAAATRRAGLPYGVSSLAGQAALASLQARDDMTVRVRSVVAERERVSQALCGLGLSVTRSEANFVWARLGADAVPFAESCRRAGVLVRAFPGEGVRITVGDPAADDAVVTAATGYFS